MHVSQAPGRQVFCIYLLSPRGTSPPASGVRGFPWKFPDKSLKKPLQGCPLHPWPRSALHQHREGCRQQERMRLSEAAAPLQPSCHAKLLSQMVSRDPQRPESCPFMKNRPKMKSFSPAGGAFGQPETLTSREGKDQGFCGTKTPALPFLQNQELFRTRKTHKNMSAVMALT